MESDQQHRGRTLHPADRILATVCRNDTEQLRIVWSTYQNRPYVSMGWWVRQNGGWHLDRARRFSVRLSELTKLVAGLAVAQTEAEAWRARWREQEDASWATYGSQGFFLDGLPV